MQLSNKNKLSLSLALAVCLCTPMSAYAANTGGDFDRYGFYIGTSTSGSNNINLDTPDPKLTNNVYGGLSDGACSNNQVTIGGELNMSNSNIYGGYTNASDAADGNTVTINSGNVKSVYGGFGDRGGANNNTVIINGGTISGDIRAGICSAATSNNNNLIINGGNINSSIGAGLSTYGTASNNTVTINGGIFSAAISIYGGSGNTSNNNSLQVYTSGVSVKSIGGFQNYDLAIAPGATTLKVDDSFALKPGDTIKSTRVLSRMKVGDTAELLVSKNGTIDISAATLEKNGIAQQGILYKYGYELKEKNGKLVAEIISREGDTQSMSVADGQLAAMGMLRSGADLVASAAMDNAAKANTEYDTFAAMNYSKMSMDSVSSVDVQGSSMLVGMGRNIGHTNSNLTVGAFLEAGWGTYESSLGVARAKGHTNYYGVGVLARNNANSGVYTEGSLRVGKVGNTYSGKTEADGTYDVSSTYYGLHLGIGKINKINDTTSTDIYAKYFYAHEGGTSANIAGDNFNFDSIDSHRVRIGGRLNSLNKNINRYVGLAYEYEFSGKATATAYGVDIATPTAKGSSGILELGLVYKPTTDSKFSMDMGMNGYVGKRKGITGNVTLNWGF